MKKSIQILSGTALISFFAVSHATAALDNACAYANANQRCVTVALAEPAQDAAAKKFQPGSGKESKIYIVRSSSAVKRQAAVISLNGAAVANLAPFTYAVASVPPGRYKIRATGGKMTELDFDVESGKTHFIQAELSLLSFSVSNNLKVLNEADGRSAVLKAVLVAPPDATE